MHCTRIHQFLKAFPPFKKHYVKLAKELELERLNQQIQTISQRILSEPEKKESLSQLLMEKKKQAEELEEKIRGMWPPILRMSVTTGYRHDYHHDLSGRHPKNKGGKSLLIDRSESFTTTHAGRRWEEKSVKDSIVSKQEENGSPAPDASGGGGGGGSGVDQTQERGAKETISRQKRPLEALDESKKSRSLQGSPC